MSKKKKPGATAQAAPTDNPPVATDKVTQKSATTELSTNSQGKTGHVTQSNTPTTPSKSIVRYNPYSIRRSKQDPVRIDEGIGQFLKIVTDYIKIFIDHDTNCTNELWYKTWTSWVGLGLNKDGMTVHDVAKIVSYTGRFKSVKAIGQHMMDKLPILVKHIVIPKQTKDQDPLVHHSKPYVITNRRSRSLEHKINVKSTLEHNTKRSKSYKQAILTPKETPIKSMIDKTKIVSNLTSLTKNKEGNEDKTRFHRWQQTMTTIS